MPLVKFAVQPGNVIRGMMIRLYPDQDTQRKLQLLQDDVRYGWNWLVGRADEARECARSAAVRQGLVTSRPIRPDYDGMQPEDSSAARLRHRDACLAWTKECTAATKDHADWRAYKLKEWMEHFGTKQDYQLLTKVIGWRHGDEPREIKPGAHMLQSLVKNYFTKATRRKRKKRQQDHVPLQVRSGGCFVLGSFGARGSTHKAPNESFYNCQVSINGLKIRGRLPNRVPAGRVLEGVTVTELANGWWASIKIEVAARSLPAPVPGTTIGLDVGLANIVATSEGDLVPNKRDRAFIDSIAVMQAAKRPVGRLQQKQARHMRHVIYSKVIPVLAGFETIKMEKISSDLGQRGSRIVSIMRTLQNMVADRYGDRVRAVDPAFTSQDCSQCGFRDKETWSYARGPVCSCTRCGYREHRDINAARNIAARPSLPPSD